MYNKLQFVKSEMRKLANAPDYIRGTGAKCPCCGKILRVTNSRPTEDGLRVRYHKCLNPLCFAHVADMTIKSVEEVKQ